MLPPLLLLLFFFVLPLMTMIGQSMSGPGSVMSAYVRVLSSSDLVLPLLYTFRVALTVTIAALILSYPVAFAVSNLRGRWLTLSLALILVPFWTSTVIRTYAWIVLLQRHGILNDALIWAGVLHRPLRLAGSDLGMEIAMVQIMLPFMMLPLLNAMRGIDRTYLKAASVLGANPFWQFARVFLPLSMPGVSAGCILVFISSLGFYVTPALLGGSKMMIAVLIEQLASQLLDWPTASALGTLLLVLTLVLFVVYERLMRRESSSHREP